VTLRRPYISKNPHLPHICENDQKDAHFI